MPFHAKNGIIQKWKLWADASNMERDLREVCDVACTQD